MIEVNEISVPCSYKIIVNIIEYKCMGSVQNIFENIEISVLMKYVVIYSVS